MKEIEYNFYFIISAIILCLGIRPLFCHTTHFCSSLIYLFPAIMTKLSNQCVFGRPWFLWTNLGHPCCQNLTSFAFSVSSQKSCSTPVEAYRDFSAVIDFPISTWDNWRTQLIKVNVPFAEVPFHLTCHNI